MRYFCIDSWRQQILGSFRLPMLLMLSHVLNIHLNAKKKKKDLNQYAPTWMLHWEILQHIVLPYCYFGNYFVSQIILILLRQKTEAVLCPVLT